VILSLVIYGSLYFDSNRRAQNERAIQMHGQRIKATVQGIYNNSCDTRGCNTTVVYQFTPLHGAQRFTSSVDLGSSRDKTRLDFARQENRVPIAYDIHNPTNSFLNFDDNVFNHDPFERAKGGELLLALLVAMACMVFLIVLYVAKPNVRPNVRPGFSDRNSNT
jgi:hypothetical protein